VAGLSWLRPALLWGMLAVALPVLIHLLGRRKRRTVGFATLRFLERAAARASARWRLRRLLLLLARMLAIAALVALSAGPGWQSAEEGAAHLKVLVVDTSLSMSAATDGTTPFERGKAALAELIGEASPIDRFILLSSAAGATAGQARVYSDDSSGSSVSGVSGGALLDSVEAASRVAALKMTAHDAGLVRALEKANAAVAGARLGSELGSALADVDELLGYLERVQLAIYRPEALFLKGRILQHQGDLSAARLVWLQAKSESEAMGERKMRWQILAGLAEIAEDEASALELLSSAREIADIIADNAGRPDVQRLISAN
jgi:hypothetical protein